MINKKVATLLNEQVTHEFHAAFLYLSMATQAEEWNMKGLASWLYVQHQEEHTHAMKISKYLIDQGVKVNLTEIHAPKIAWKNNLDIVKDALAHEQKVTQQFNNMMDVAIQEKDYASVSFLQWFISEQVEEEASFIDLMAKYEMAGDNKGATMFIDAELATRTFVPAFPVKATPVQLA